MTITLLCAALALGSQWDDALRMEDLNNSGRPEEAVAGTGAVLARDPGDLGAHYVHITARVRGLRQGPEVEAQYRRWLAEKPDLLAARFGLAAARTMVAIPDDRDGAWCDEVETLIGGPLPTGPQQVWVLRLRIDARRHCPQDAGPDVAALVVLGRTDDLALAWSIRERVRGAVISAAVADDFDLLTSRAPELGSETGPLLVGDYSGDGRARVATAQLAAQRLLVGSSEPRVVAFAATALSLAKDNDSAQLALRQLTEVDPGRSWTVPTSEKLARWYLRDKPQRTEPSPKPLLLRLNFALDPNSGDRGMVALGELKAIWERDPRDSDAAYAFARAAVVREDFLGLAIGALDYAINSVPAWDPRGASREANYDAWRRNATPRQALWLSERGWLRHLTGHHSMGAEDLRLAVLLHPEPPGEFHLRLGLVYYDLGYEDAALHHLGRGLGMDGTSLQQAPARKAAEELFTRLAWAPGGLDGWIEDQRVAREKAD